MWLLFSPKGWLLLTIYCSVSLIIGLILIFANVIKKWWQVLLASLVLVLVAGSTIGVINDNFVNVSDEVQYAIGNAVWVFIPLVLMSFYGIKQLFVVNK